jgi:hypothetical protein
LIEIPNINSNRKRLNKGLVLINFSQIFILEPTVNLWYIFKLSFIQKGLRIYPSTVAYRTLPYCFPRGTVLVNRTAYRTFVTVFRDFCLKARTLPRIKCSRFAVLTLIFRKSANRTKTRMILTLKTLI